MHPKDPQFWLKEITINLNVITLLAVHGNLLLALRHPQNVGAPRDIALNFCKQIGEQLVLLGAMTPEQLEEAYKLESEEGTPELMDDIQTVKSPELKPFVHRAGNNDTKLVVSSSMDSETLFAMLLRKAECCSCGNPMKSSPLLNFVSIDKKAEWKHPVWDNMLLKPEYPRIPRAVAVLCSECIESQRMAEKVIEIEGEEIKYHNVADLEDAYEITPDMVAQNIKDLRDQNG